METGKPSDTGHLQPPGPAAVSRLPHTVDNMMQQQPVLSYNPNVPPVGHSVPVRPGLSGPMSSHPQYHQQLAPYHHHNQPPTNYSHFQYDPYHPQQHMTAGGGHYMTPMQPPQRPAINVQQHYLTGNQRFPPQQTGWSPSYGVPPAGFSPSPYEVHAPAIPNQTSSSFMMESIIQPSSDTASTKISLSTSQIVEDDEDEMSSYMTMASFVTSKTSST